MRSRLHHTTRCRAGNLCAKPRIMGRCWIIDICGKRQRERRGETREDLTFYLACLSTVKCNNHAVVFRIHFSMNSREHPQARYVYGVHVTQLSTHSAGRSAALRHSALAQFCATSVGSHIGGWATQLPWPSQVSSPAASHSSVLRRRCKSITESRTEGSPPCSPFRSALHLPELHPTVITHSVTLRSGSSDGNTTSTSGAHLVGLPSSPAKWARRGARRC